MNALISNPIARKISGITFARDNVLYIVEAFLDPIIIVITLWALCIFDKNKFDASFLILSFILFSLTFPGTSKINLTGWEVIRNNLTSWFILAGLLLTFGITTDLISQFDRETIILWIWITPLLQILAAFALRKFAPSIIKLQGATKLVIIAGINAQGLAIADRLTHSKYYSMKVLGFFDDRAPERVAQEEEAHPLLGNLSEMANYVKENDINTIYLSLPMARQQRIIKLLDDLQDTTASIYFVPDIFMTDLIQGRMNEVDGVPIVAVRETPFTGFDGMLKRSADFVFALFVLILISPLLLLISLGIKLTSSGPVIFKQRRYGLDGKEILVYKFRSMTVCEDGSKVTQATKDDQRITKLGGFLRKTSLDELPQFVNVLQGSMSIVGPRPHAVAHNEMYRKLIKGYMIRHKVKPGITGWAQVNGLRGETDTIEKMQARIDYDIDYLRNWSPKLDMYIVIKTIAIMALKQDSAY